MYNSTALLGALVIISVGLVALKIVCSLKDGRCD